jgi:formamidopyrimidine-DNA glycosylase
VHPARPADRVRPAELAALADAIGAVLRESLAGFRAEERRRNAALRRGERDAFTGPLYLAEGARGSPFDAYARVGSPCHRCGTAIESLVIAARTSAFCPRCQER